MRRRIRAPTACGLFVAALVAATVHAGDDRVFGQQFGPGQVALIAAAACPPSSR